MFINIERELVAVSDGTKHGEVWTNWMPREEFSEKYNIPLDEEWAEVFYQPLVGHYGLKFYDERYVGTDKPEGLPVLASIHANKDQILEDFYVDYVIKNRPSDLHTFNAQEVKWEITPENQAILDKNARRGEYTQATRDKLDTEVRKKGFDHMISAVTYANSNGRWKAQGIAAMNWRDNVWEIAEQIMDDIDNGVRPPPTIQEFLDELPTITWPAGL